MSEKKKITRREFLKSSGLMGAGLVAATTPSISKFTVPSVVSKPTEIKYWSFFGPSDDNPRANAQTQMVNLFNDQNSDIKVVVEKIPWQDLRPQLLQSSAAGTAPDIAREVDQYILTFAEAGAVEPLDEFMSGWDDSMRNDFLYPLEDCQADGVQYGFRQSVRPANVLYYRTDLLEEAGFSEPPKTWDEFHDAILKTTTKDIAGFGFGMSKTDGMAHVIQLIPPMLWGLDSDLVDIETGTPLFQEEEGVSVFKWLQDLIHVHEAFPVGIVSMDASAVDQLFLGGTMAFFFGNTAKWGQWSEAEGVKGRLATVGMPNFGNDPSIPGSANQAGAWTHVMGKGAKKEEAWRFMEFLFSNEAELIVTEVGGELPTRRSTLDLPWFSTDEAQRSRDYLEWMGANPHTASTLKIRKIEELIEALANPLQEIMITQADVKTKLDEAAQKYIESLG